MLADIGMVLLFGVAVYAAYRVGWMRGNDQGYDEGYNERE